MKNLSTNYFLRSTFKGWLIPLLVSIGLFLIIRPVLAQIANTPGSVQVGEEVKDGFSRVYYLRNDMKTFIGPGNQNSKAPNSSGEYITWVTDINDAGGQIFLFNLLSGTSAQLTFLGTNLNPKVDGKGRVVWEGWDPSAGSGQGTWQIFFFDGKSVRQLTTGDTTVNPDFGGEYISYGRRDVSGTWRAVVYSIKEDKSVDVMVGEKARDPQIRNGVIYLAAGRSDEEKFPLSVTDLFLLNLTPLTATGSAPSTSSGLSSLTASSSAEPATTSAILNELTASPSGVVEISR